MKVAPRGPPEVLASAMPAGFANPFAPRSPTMPPSVGFDPFALGPATATPLSRPIPATPFALGPPTTGEFDPFAPASPSSAPAPFEAGLTSGPSPFGPPFGASPMGAAPFGDFGPDAGLSTSRGESHPDPFADQFDLGGPLSAGVRPSPPIPVDDPFAEDVGQAFDADARAELFGITLPPPTPTTPTTPVLAAPPRLDRTGPVTARVAAATPPAVPPAKSTAERMVPAVRALVSALQAVAFVAFTMVAIVLGRGGSIGALLAMDPNGAFAVNQAPGGLLIDDVRIGVRQTASDLSLLVITGVVHHRGQAPLPGIVVEATLGDGVVARGQAWAVIDGVAVDRASTDDDILALQQASSSSPAVSPGESAPFAIIARAPADLDAVTLTAMALTPPAAPPPPPAAETQPDTVEPPAKRARPRRQ